jgi:hypothetical protein
MSMHMYRYSINSELNGDVDKEVARHLLSKIKYFHKKGGVVQLLQRILLQGVKDMTSIFRLKAEVPCTQNINSGRLVLLSSHL